MKTFRLLAVLILSAPAALVAQSEGFATFKVNPGSSDAQKPQGTSKIAFSRSAVRVDAHLDLAPMGSSRDERSRAPRSYDTTMIQKLSEPDKLYIVNDASRSYSVMDLAKTRQDTPRSDEKWSVKRGGRGSVAGVACENATMTSSKGGTVDACVATEVMSSMSWWSAMNRQGSGQGTWVKAMDDAGLRGLPVRMVVKSADGKPSVDMELVSLERRSVPSSMFEIPASYKQTSTGMAVMSPEQQKMMNDALSKMTPEQRKAYEDAMKRAQQPQ